jgi:ABC-type Fe3+/spermidine/putrescine transport system ATPase subunit
MFVGGGMKLPAHLISANGESAICELANGTRWPARLLSADGAAPPGSEVQLLARPDALDLTRAHAGTSAMGTVTERRFAGAFAVYTVRLGDSDVLVNAGTETAEIGEGVVLRPKSSISLFAFSQ